MALCLFTGLLFAMVFSLDATVSWFRGAAELHVIFEDVQGARVADPVYFHGVPCGRVSRVEFWPNPDPPRVAVAAAPRAASDNEHTASAAQSSMAVRLTLSLPQQVRDAVRVGSVAKIDKTLTGITVVSVHQGDGAPLPLGSMLTGRESVALSAVTEKLSLSAELMARTLEDVQAVVGDCRARGLIPGAFAAVEEVSSRSEALLETLHEIVLDQRDVIPQLTERASGALDRVNALLEAGPDVVADLELAVREYQRVAYDARSWLRDLRPHVDATGEDLARAADNVAWLSTDLRHRPWRLLHAPDEEEVKQLELFQTAAEYGRGASELRRAVDRLALLLDQNGAGGTEGPALTELLDSFDTRLSRQGAFEEALWQRMLRWGR
ncbi:MAG: MlaD family protein [Planctomycetota bacterium]